MKPTRQSPQRSISNFESALFFVQRARMDAKRRSKARAKRNRDRGPWKIDLLVKILVALITLIEHWPWSK